MFISFDRVGSQNNGVMVSRVLSTIKSVEGEGRCSIIKTENVCGDEP